MTSSEALASGRTLLADGTAGLPFLRGTIVGARLRLFYVGTLLPLIVMNDYVDGINFGGMFP